MNYLSNCYRTIKLSISGISGLAGIGAIASGIIIGGTGGTILIVGGGLWSLTAGFSIFDSIAVHSAIMRDVKKLKENVEKFNSENIKLSGNIVKLELAKNEYIYQNKKLAESLKQSEQQIGSLSELKTQYEVANTEYVKLLASETQKLEVLENQNILYTKENTRLADMVNEISTMQNKFKKENDMLKKFMEDNKKYIEQLESAKITYINENEKLQLANKENLSQLEILKNQVSKLKELYNNSKELLKNLALAGDLFNQFNSTLNTNILHINDTADTLSKTHDDFDQTLIQMRNLVNKLKNSTFDDLDKNHDGIISKDEFENAIKN